MAKVIDSGNVQRLQVKVNRISTMIQLVIITSKEDRFDTDVKYIGNAEKIKLLDEYLLQYLLITESVGTRYKCCLFQYV